MSLYIWMVIMLLASLLWLIWFLYNPLKIDALDLEKSNIELGRQKQAELEQDLQDGLIDQSVFAQAKDEIAQVLAVEIGQTTTYPQQQKSPTIGLILLVAAFFLIAPLATYQLLTSNENAPMAAEKTPTLTQRIADINQRLAQTPNDAKAWRLLGFALFESDKIDESLQAYQRSYQLDAKNAQMLTEYASTLAISQNNQFTGRVSTLVREALEIDKNLPDALYLAGWVAINAQQFELAQKLWKKAILLSKNKADKAVLQQILGELLQLQNAKTPKPTDAKKSLTAHQVTIKVALPQRLLKPEFEEHYLLIYIKAAQGRPMPIAIQKIRLKDFSGVVVLTDDDSIIPSRKLSQTSSVIAVARLSKSGSAMRQAGDIEALSPVIDVADNPIVNLELK
ncbi:MAG: c-type cytochrome biogenesis protein CcmI [Candidatus Thioglobus sp.]|nr:MAG: c-type cytochrome biogenesis protein CcmI [Candidatus Thioglobus sp.]